MTMNCSNPECLACRRIPISVGAYPRPRLSPWTIVAIMLGLALGIGVFVGGCEESPALRWNCVLCAPGGDLSCADPGVDPCPGAKPSDTLPICGVIPGYSIALADCGGAMIDGLRCATRCTWQIGPDAGAELFGHAAITIPPGCTLQVNDEPGVCVTNCSDCR